MHDSLNLVVLKKVNDSITIEKKLNCDLIYKSCKLLTFY